MQNISPVQTSADAARTLSPRQPLRWIALLALTLFILRLSAPPNLLDQDQENPAAYVLDVVKNGQWICQRDLSGDITSKPPLYTWLAATASILSGRVTLFSLYLPGALALFGSACLVFLFGRDFFGRRAGLFGAVACLLCTAGLKQLGLARTDGVFAFTVTAAALLAYRSWIVGRGWTWFWLATAAATLTKGPLGVVLASGGLLAVLWERARGELLPLRGSHWLGVGLFLLITGGWLALAYVQFGHALLDKLLLRELVFHVVEGEQKKVPGSLFYLSPLYYLGRGAPWSLLAYYGLWRIWKNPATGAPERRFERFLFCWFLSGLVLFSLAPHQRGDLLWPIMPAGALIAGRELARLTSGLSEAKSEQLLTGVAVLAVLGFGAYYFGPRARQPCIKQTVAVRELARQIRRFGEEDFPLTHADDPVGLQVYLNTRREPVSLAQAAELLRAKEPAFVAVSDWSTLQSFLDPKAGPVYILLAANGPVAKLNVRVVSNQPRLPPVGESAFAFGPWLVRAAGGLLSAGEDHLTFRAGGGEVAVTNTGPGERKLRLVFRGAEGSRGVITTVAPGQTVRVSRALP